MAVLDIDSVFIQGTTHDVCQDYAATAMLSAWLSDGCSRVLDSVGGDTHAKTDIGARILVHQAMQSVDLEPTAGKSLQSVLHMANVLRVGFGLPYAAMTATLAGVQKTRAGIVASFWGDGGLVCRGVDGVWSLLRLEFDGPPRYPVTSSLQTCRADWVRGDVESPWPMSAGYPYWLQLDTARYNAAAVVSDGFFSFLKDGQPVDVTDQLLDVRGLRGKWCQRHLRGVLKELASQGIHPMDDISMAGIAIR